MDEKAIIICISQKKVVPLQPQRYATIKLKTMFGVRSSNQPITGKFAEEFIRHLLDAKKQHKEEEMNESFEIVCD